MASPPVRSSTLPTSLPSEVGRDDEQGENGSSPPQPGHMPSRWDGKGPLDSAVPEEMTGLHWENCCNYVDKYDEDICRVWKEEIDKLLIFAGLFSAAVTAFAVEAFQWLEDPSDANTALLAQLVALQLNGAPDPPTAPFRPGASAIRINIFWFTSLTLSLGSVLVGILCLQWLREYQRPVPTLSFKDRLIYRQNRYDGLIAWKVPEIVSTLPLLLQISVILFFAGVFDLLWERNQIVALVILVQFIIITLLLALSAIIPALQIARSWFSYNGATQKNWPIYKQCPYKSPQSWLACHFILYVLDVVWRCVDHSSEVSLWTQMRVNFSQTSWFAFDEFCFAFGNRQVTSSIGWMQKNCPRNSKITHQLYQCISDLGHGELPAIWETTQAFSPSEAWKSLMKDKDSEAYKTSTLSTPSYRELLSAFFLDTFHQSLPATVEHWIRAVNAEPLLLKKMPARRFLEELPEDKHGAWNI
ncbi:hypothetical protein BDN72DRAFT_863749 [Pluteus cervinus]|uniref:Uncharacterized protein n=1 Tax=Pluteus cervinus TaxID=181527 RepID=A0ACD3A5U1_9AGAR|nr:hypothetical protein BDN72DRAFT_863749 [Pluteus cervinus]